MDGMSLQSSEIESVKKRALACLARANEAMRTAHTLQEASKVLRAESAALVSYNQKYIKPFFVRKGQVPQEETPNGDN